jgi:uncharacterized membrane protein
MSTHEHTVVVDRPITTVYDQWTQFESYPRFMDNVESVRQMDPAMTHWKVSVAGVEREYDAQILQQKPGEIIEWRSVSGPEQGGRVTFLRVDPEHTRVTLKLDFEPHGVTERVGEAVGVVSSSVKDSLERFKEFIEERGEAEGGWHGRIESPSIHDVGVGREDAGRLDDVDVTDAPITRMEAEGGIVPGPRPGGMA